MTSSDKFPENSGKGLLTCIHNAYTVSGTNDDVEALMVKNFLNTLAEVALAVALREVKDR